MFKCIDESRIVGGTAATLGVKFAFFNYYVNYEKASNLS